MRVALLLLVVLGALGLGACDDAPERPRRMQTVRLLPDTPPPPPPRPEDKPPPRPEAKPQPQDAPKPAELPLPQALKEEGPAGDGPGSGLAAGTVNEDYTSQSLGSGTAIGASAPDGGIGRVAASSYGNATTRALNEFLTRERSLKLRDYQVRVELWLAGDGGLRRAELVDSTGDPATDQALRAALERFPGNAAPPPPGLPQPVRVRVSNRLMG